VDLGGETRQLVAGIKKSYLPESLVGKRIIVVANLKPAVLRGVESRGMLLAASTDEGPILATFEKEVAAGSKVK
jgi:methionyl-tRNA synthetase